MERFRGGENYISSVESVDVWQQEERRRDLQFTRALLNLMGKAPYLRESLPYILHGIETRKGHY